MATKYYLDRKGTTPPPKLFDSYHAAVVYKAQAELVTGQVYEIVRRHALGKVEVRPTP